MCGCAVAYYTVLVADVAGPFDSYRKNLREKYSDAFSVLRTE